MNFSKKEITYKKIAIIDIGSYKIKVAICEYKANELSLVGYGEKRQDLEHTLNGEYKDIEGICENINIAIKKAEDDSGFKVNDIVVNFPYCDIFFATKKLNYKRKKGEKKIDKSEAKKIIKKAELLCIESGIKEIKNKFGVEKENLKIIVNNVSRITLDKKKITQLDGLSGTDINISLLNVFIPLSKYNLIEYTANALNKNILKIIPLEYSLTNLFEKKEAVIIDLGSSQTSLIIKAKNRVIGLYKFSLGINNLIEEIQKNHKLLKSDIIKNIDLNVYLKEKDKFLEIFRDYIIIGINDLLGSKICPNNFFITGGGANEFIKDFITKRLNSNNDLKIAKNIELIKPSIKGMGEVESGSNINIVSMIVTCENFLNTKDDLITKSLRKVINESL